MIPDEYLFDDNDIAVRIERIAGNLTGYFVFEDIIIKGFIAANPCPDADAEDVFELRVLYVEPQFQGSGIGTSLVLFFEKIAADHGFNKVCLYVLQENTKARTFYTRLGYLLDGAQKAATNYEGTHIRYSKTL